MNKAGPTLRSKIRGQRLRRGVWVACVCLLVAFWLRNWAAQQVIERLSSHRLQAHVSLQRVDVRLPWITITGLRIAEHGNSDETLLTVQQIAVAPSILQGWREGVWLRAVRINEPTVRLRLAEDSSLSSRFPPLGGSGGGSHEGSFLAARVTLRGGRLFVEQAGKLIEVAGGLELQLASGRELALRGKIARLLGGQLRFSASIDSTDAPDLVAQADKAARVAWHAERIDLDQLAACIGLATLQGEVDLRGLATVACSHLADLSAWQAVAEVKLRRCVGEGWQLGDTAAHLSAAAGTLRLALPAEILSSSIAGRTELEAIAELRQDQRLAFSISSRTQLQHRLASASADPPGQSEGTFSLMLTADVPLESTLRAEAWNARWTLDARNLMVVDEPVSDFRVAGQILQGRLAIPEFVVAWRDVPSRIGLCGQIEPIGSLRCQFRAGPFRLADIAELAERVSQSPLPLDGQADLEGYVRLGGSGGWVAEGNLQLDRTRYLDRPLGDVSLDWKADRHGVELKSESVDFLGGSFGVAARMPALDWTRTTVSANAQGIQLQRLVELAHLKVDAGGTLSGQVEVSSWGDLSSLSALGQLQGEKLRFAGLAFTLGKNELHVGDGKLVAQVIGECGDGRAQLNATAELADLLEFASYESLPPIDSLPLQATATITGVSLARLADGLLTTGNRHRLDGRLSASFVRDTRVITERNIGIGSIAVERLSCRSMRLSDRITAAVSLRSDRLRLDKLEGRLADGQVRGQGELVLRHGRPRGRLSVAADRVSLRRACSAWPSLAASGTANINLHAKLDGSLTGRADLSVDNAAVSNLQVRHARVPINWDYSLPTATARWNCRGATIELGGGKAVLTSRGEFAGGLSTSTLIRLDRIDTAKLLQNRSVGLGTIDGQVTVNARKATSIQQLQGRFDLELSKVQPLKVPILEKIPQLVQTPELLQSDVVDDGGYMYGSFGGGTIRLEQLALWQKQIQILADGQATLAGRLNLMVTISTLRGGPADQWLALAQSPLMLAAPAPVAILVQANELLKDRVLHVSVSGTASRPIVQPQPGHQLAQQALRFFIRGATGGQLVDAADWNQRPRRR